MKIKENLHHVFWGVVVLSICSGVSACLSTTPTAVRDVALTSIPSASHTPASVQTTLTPSQTSPPTASLVPTALVSPTIPPATNVPILPTHATAVTTPTSLPPCGQSIVFESKYRRTHSLAMVDVCSQEIVFLTDDQGHDEWPRWSPDGRHIAYLSDRGEPSADYRDLWLMDTATGKISQITHDEQIWSSGAAFVWSPSGDEILYSSESEDRSVPRFVKLRDGRIRSLSECFTGPFAWSLDKARIALEMCVEPPADPPAGHENDVWTPGKLVIIRPDGSLIAGDEQEYPYRLPNSSGWFWSPDSQTLAVALFGSLRGSGGGIDLVSIVDEDLVLTANLRDLLPWLEYTMVQSAAWSPNGEEIALVVVEPARLESPYRGQIYVVDRNFTQYRILTSEGVFCDGVQWSPDGSQLTFACDDGEPYSSIWVVNADGTDLHPITKPEEDVRAPQWQPVPQP